MQIGYLSIRFLFGLEVFGGALSFAYVSGIVTCLDMIRQLGTRGIANGGG